MSRVGRVLVDAALVLLVVLLAALIAKAYGAPPTVVEPRPASEPLPVDLERGDPAPFAGTLIPVELAYACADCRLALADLEARAERDAAKAAAELLRVAEERDAERDGRLELDRKLREITACEGPSLVESPVLWGGVGLVVGAGLALLVAYLAGGL